MIDKVYAVQPDNTNGWWVVSRDEDGWDCLDESADGGYEQETAKRIALSWNLLKHLSVEELEGGCVCVTAKEN